MLWPEVRESPEILAWVSTGSGFKDSDGNLLMVCQV